jgi:hypothetical protein
MTRVFPYIIYVMNIFRLIWALKGEFDMNERSHTYVDEINILKW